MIDTRERTANSILLADDDEEYRMLLFEALRESLLPNPIYSVEDGEELMDYLHVRGKYAPPAEAPRPGIILLDLNMPKKSGREALREINLDPILQRIPVVVLTTSESDEDTLRSYVSGASLFISKPDTFDGMVHLITGLGLYWPEIVALPR